MFILFFTFTTAKGQKSLFKHLYATLYFKQIED